MRSELDELIEYNAERESLIVSISTCLSALDNVFALWYERPQRFWGGASLNMVVSDDLYQAAETTVEARLVVINKTGRTLSSSLYAKEYIHMDGGVAPPYLNVIYPGTIAPHDLGFTWTPLSEAAVCAIGIDFLFEKVPIRRSAWNVGFLDCDPPAYLDDNDRISRAFCYFWGMLHALVLSFPRHARNSVGNVPRLKDQSFSYYGDGIRRVERFAGMQETADAEMFAGVDTSIASEVAYALVNHGVRVKNALEQMGIFPVDPELPDQTRRLIDLSSRACELGLSLRG